MKNSNEFYVYVLLDPRKCYSPFYVGKGHGSRAKISAREAGTNSLKKNVIYKIKNSGHKPVIMYWEKELNECRAFEIEIELIARWGRRNNNTGILTNLTDGGEGTVGVSAETRKKMADRMRGAGSPTFGGQSEENRKKMREGQRIWREERAAKGIEFHHTEEHKQHLRDNNAGGKATALPIFQIHPETGIVIKEWPSSKAAGEALNGNYPNIANRAKDGSYHMAYGYYWRWKGSQEINDGYLTTIEKMNEIRLRPTGEEIYQYDLQNILVKKWNSFMEASEELTIDYHSIWAANKNKRSFDGYYWVRSTENVVDFRPRLRSAGKKKINQIKDGVIIATWDSTAEAAKSFGKSPGGIQCALKRKQKCYGFHWEFV